MNVCNSPFHKQIPAIINEGLNQTRIIYKQTHTEPLQFIVYILNISFREKTEEIHTAEKVINQMTLLFSQPGSSSLLILLFQTKSKLLDSKK